MNRTIRHLPILAIALLGALISGAKASHLTTRDLYVVGYLTHQIGKFNADDGTVINASLITFTDTPSNVATVGTDLFVVTANYMLPSLTKVQKYQTDGTLVNADFITGLDSAWGIAVSGTDLYVVSSGKVGKYKTDGTVVNANLISLPLARYVAVSGTNLYVLTEGGAAGGKVAKYTTDGTPVNTSFITSYGMNPQGIAATPTNIFVGDASFAVVARYQADGTFIDTIAAGTSTGLAVSGTDLYSSSGTVYVGKFKTDGTIVNTHFIPDFAYPYGLAVTTEAPPTPTPTPAPTNGVAVTVAPAQRSATFTVKNTGSSTATVRLATALRVNNSFSGRKPAKPTGNDNIVTCTRGGANITRDLLAGTATVSLAPGASTQITVKVGTRRALVFKRALHVILTATALEKSASAEAILTLKAGTK